MESFDLVAEFEAYFLELVLRVVLEIIEVEEVSLALGRGVLFGVFLALFVLLVLFVLPFAKHLYLN